MIEPPKDIHPSEYEWIQVDFDIEFANDEDSFNKLQEFSKVIANKLNNKNSRRNQRSY